MTQADAAQKVGFLAAAKTERRVIDWDRGFSAGESASEFWYFRVYWVVDGQSVCGDSCRGECFVLLGGYFGSVSHEVSLTCWNVVIWRYLVVESRR